MALQIVARTVAGVVVGLVVLALTGSLGWAVVGLLGAGVAINTFTPPAPPRSGR